MKAHRYPKGLIARDQKSAEKAVYQKLRRVAPKVRAREPVTPEVSLMKASIGSIDSLVQTLVASREMRKETLLQVLKKSRQQTDYARAVQVAKSYVNHSGRRLLPPHLAQVMACAVLSDKWVDALQMYARQGLTPAAGTSPSAPGPAFVAASRPPQDWICTNQVLNQRALIACRPAVRWVEAMWIYNMTLRANATPSSHVLTSLSSVLRRSPRWDLAFTTFVAATGPGGLLANAPSSDVLADAPESDAPATDLDDTAITTTTTDPNVSTPFKPSYQLYRKMLGLMHDRRVECPSAWSTGLQMIRSMGLANLKAGMPITTGDPQLAEFEPPACTLGPQGLDIGLANLAIRLAGGSGHWQEAVHAFLAHTAHGALCDTHCNAATYEALSDCRPSDPHFQGIVFTAMLRSGFSATHRMFGAFFGALHAAGRSDEALRTFYNYYDVAVTRPEDITVPLSALYDGMLTSLLHHEAPEQALVIAKELRGNLECAVTDFIGALTTWGEEMQRWTADGRVLVIDADVLLTASKAFLSELLTCYDSVVVPFTAARKLIEKFEESDEADKKKLAALHQLVNVTAHKPSQHLKPFRVIPFVHELQAHTHLMAVKDAVASNATISTSSSDLELLREAEAANMPQIGPSTGGVRIVADVKPSSSWVPRFGASTTQSRGGVATPPTATINPPAKLRTDRLNLRDGEAHTAAVAVMLKRLNPDAEVSVMTGNHSSRQIANDAADALLWVQSSQADEANRAKAAPAKQGFDTRQKYLDHRTNLKAKSLQVLWMPTWSSRRTINDAAEDAKRKEALNRKVIQTTKTATETRDMSAYRAAVVEYSANRLAGEAASIPGFFHPA